MIRQRCAIYTRKSTEEGLEQDFSSLDAQREACAAYISAKSTRAGQSSLIAMTMVGSPADPWTDPDLHNCSMMWRQAASTLSLSTRWTA